ncbi:hypothetical protein GGTG_12052 [Gaeumannomyces tritici R3-111a-1]|uniref:Uncharacterized protein n=1 Tax=Gaeumannomyces tritici (strain R3-111a-1) TaxID=644352 RepID=J3PEX3_GAET3|nr:hypothetical protein GGTG_12052 [Gaeumannomyces tritici R3-111a-1]EJT71031.1 hypothetical protein GGTG_12052 [Gaeumannomyces tritici R3-111a-1]
MILHRLVAATIAGIAQASLASTSAVTDAATVESRSGSDMWGWATDKNSRSEQHQDELGRRRNRTVNFHLDIFSFREGCVPKTVGDGGFLLCGCDSRMIQPVRVHRADYHRRTTHARRQAAFRDTRTHI